MSKRLFIQSVGRTTTDGKLEALVFKEGVNVIVGPQNAGKTTWLKMLDYLMGEPESAAEKFDEALVEKYRSISANLVIDGSTFEIERYWREDGRRGFFTLNGDRIAADDVQTFFLDHLHIPELRYPQGNVHASHRTWPLLGWRSLLRHIYRRQNFWSDLVPQQPESEQHACLLQFLGLAEHLFTGELSALVDKQRQIARLQNRKEYFIEILHQIVPDLISDQDREGGISAHSIEAARTRALVDVDQLTRTRTAILHQVRGQNLVEGREFERIGSERSETLHQRSVLEDARLKIEDRIQELKEYRSSLQMELDRLSRVNVAASIFEGLKVTHCPACDQSVAERPYSPAHCFLCGQATPEQSSTPEAATKRLEFERVQITAEIAEADELIVTLQQDHDEKIIQLAANEHTLRQTEAMLRPFQASVSNLVPEEIGLIDQRIGALNSKLEALQKLHEPIKNRDALSQQIEVLESEVRDLEDAISEREAKAEFAIASDRLTAGFNTYLDFIRRLDVTSWTKSGTTSVRLTERRAHYLIDGRPAKIQLGGTLTIFFLFAYHYALLNLTRFPDTHYPGLTILDFFPDIAKGAAVSDRLALVLAPFVKLIEEPDFGSFQVIATSRSFAEQKNVNLIHLSDVWR